MRHFNRMSWDCCGSNQALLVSCCLHLSFFLSESFNCLKFGLARDLNDLRWKRKARCAEWRHGGGRGAGFFKPDHYLCLLLWGGHNSFETPHLGESSVCLSSFPFFFFVWSSVNLFQSLAQRVINGDAHPQSPLCQASVKHLYQFSSLILPPDTVFFYLEQI